MTSGKETAPGLGSHNSYTWPRIPAPASMGRNGRPRPHGPGEGQPPDPVTLRDTFSAILSRFAQAPLKTLSHRAQVCESHRRPSAAVAWGRTMQGHKRHSYFPTGLLDPSPHADSAQTRPRDAKTARRAHLHTAHTVSKGYEGCSASCVENLISSCYSFGVSSRLSRGRDVLEDLDVGKRSDSPWSLGSRGQVRLGLPGHSQH